MTLENAKRLYKAGGGTREDVEQAELNLKVAKLEKLQLENEIKSKQQTMQVQMKEAEIAADIQDNDLKALAHKLQLADIVAGAANRWAKWHINQRNPKDVYGCALDEVVTTLHCYLIGPPPHFTTETPPPNFPNSNSNYITQVILKSKLEAIQRLEEAGAQFFYIYRPE